MVESFTRDQCGYTHPWPFCGLIFWLWRDPVVAIEQFVAFQDQLHVFHISPWHFEKNHRSIVLLLGMWLAWYDFSGHGGGG